MINKPEIKILVVDDEVGVTRLCQRLLEKEGYAVKTTNRPQNGLVVLEREHIDLLLVDIRMPEMDGFTLMAEAKIRQQNLAIVIMTGYGTVETAVESLRRGADALILKPFSRTELVETVHRALIETQRKREVLRLQALRPLFGIIESLFSEKNPDHLIELLIDITSENLRCPHISYFQLIEGENRYSRIAGRGKQLQGEDDAINVLMETLDEPVRFDANDMEESEFQIPISTNGFGSVMFAPNNFTSEQSVLFVGRNLDEPSFSDADLEMLAILARQSAVALENAKLYAELHKNIRKVEESQRALIQAEKLAAVGRLTASIAHELNNPLQSVSNCLHLTGKSELSDKARRSYLDLAQAELDRLMNAVKRMLDYYRPGAVDRESVDINELLGKVLKLLKAQLDNYEIIIHTQLDPDLPLIQVVGNQIQQVFVNIILNAMDAMPEGGHLYIETKRGEDVIIISIEDTGPGVPASQRERIFEPFVSTKEEGLGLGLTVSYGIVTAHGGTLELVPGKDKGARFCVSLSQNPLGENSPRE